MFIHHTNLDDADADKSKLVCYDCGVACDLARDADRAARLPGEAGRGDTEEEEGGDRARDPS